MRSKLTIAVLAAGSLGFSLGWLVQGGGAELSASDTSATLALLADSAAEERAAGGERQALEGPALVPACAPCPSCETASVACAPCPSCETAAVACPPPPGCAGEVAAAEARGRSEAAKDCPAPRDCRPDIDAAVSRAVAQAEQKCPAPRDCRPDIDAAVSAALAQAEQSRPAPRDCGPEIDAAVSAARHAATVGSPRGAADAREQLASMRSCVDRLGSDAPLCLAQPVPFPPGLDPAYRGPLLLERFRASFGETSLAGIIDGVECDEYPCIVRGRIDDDVPVTQLLRAPSLQVYAAGRTSYSFAKAEVTAADGAKRPGRTFTVAVYAVPGSSAEEEQILARLALRRAR